MGGPRPASRRLRLRRSCPWDRLLAIRRRGRPSIEPHSRNTLPSARHRLDPRIGAGARGSVPKNRHVPRRYRPLPNTRRIQHSNRRRSLPAANGPAQDGGEPLCASTRRENKTRRSASAPLAGLTHRVPLTSEHRPPRWGRPQRMRLPCTSHQELSSMNPPGMRIHPIVETVSMERTMLDATVTMAREWRQVHHGSTGWTELRGGQLSAPSRGSLKVPTPFPRGALGCRAAKAA